MSRIAAATVAALLLLSCTGDDGGQDGAATTTSTSGIASTTTVTPGPIVGPTTSTTVNPNCQLAADAYVESAAMLFDDRPDDDEVDDIQARLQQLDFAANADGCGDAYRIAVCDGLDELTRSGTLVIYQLLSAQCI